MFFVCFVFQFNTYFISSTSECRYLVLPERPASTEHFTEEQLIAVISRDSMIGVRKIK